MCLYIISRCGLLKSQGLYIYLSVLSGVTRGAGPAGTHSGRAPAHFRHQPFYLSDLSLRSAQATFQGALLHPVSSLSVTPSTAAIITTTFPGHHGGIEHICLQLGCSEQNLVNHQVSWRKQSAKDSDKISFSHTDCCNKDYLQLFACLLWMQR